MKPGLRVTLAILIVTTVVGLANPFSVQAKDAALCSYWQSNITQWADLITKYSADNGLDPNFVAALIEEESKGNPRLISRAGAVGLMQIMPYETGFTWRPRTWTLLKPEANLEWGTNTLNEVIRQAQGRLTLAVLAYNSGWDRIQLRSARLFAAKVFDHYARCIASQRGLDPKQLNDYAVYVVAHSSAAPTYVDRFKSDGTFEPLANFDPEQISPDMPHAVAFSLLDENHIAWWVEVWVANKAIQPSSSLTKTTNFRTTE
jgi:membrane-bound lytic murein transglycosylase MltF